MLAYTELLGNYDRDEINQIYRSHSALFLSFRESFGLPIVENQLCGNIIFSPQKNWVPSHYINKSAYEGDLGSNFVIYDNDLIKLKPLINECKKNYRPEAVLEHFITEYPHVYKGDLIALQEFIDKVLSGDISGNSHRSHEILNKGINRSL
jgi:hypothetical protein